jgi:hypothetical protein
VKGGKGGYGNFRVKYFYPYINVEKRFANIYARDPRRIKRIGIETKDDSRCWFYWFSKCRQVNLACFSKYYYKVNNN